MMQNTAMFSQKIGLCKFYEFIRFLYEKAVTVNKEYTTFGDGIIALECKPRKQKPGAPLATAHLLLHGGGFIYGSPMTVAKFSEHLCNSLGHDVIALKYPLAPEHIFPEPLVYVARAIKMFCNRYDTVHLVGVSAGANLALSACLLLADVGEKRRPHTLTLIGGPYSFNTGALSYRRNKDGPKLTKSMICQYWSLYIDGNQGKKQELFNKFQTILNQKASSFQEMYQLGTNYLAYCVPIDSNFILGLPKTLVLVAEEDILLSDSIALYRKLKNERSEALLKVYPGAHIHLAEENGIVEQDIIRTMRDYFVF